jgi:hypothetical protein
MHTPLTLGKFSFGMGDRFAQQAAAQLRACQLAAQSGVDVVPVWNKSNREHTFIGSEPQSVLDAAKAAVERLGWTAPWHVDADHIRLETVDRFVPCSDFFTIDVADSIGRAAPAGDRAAFVERHPELVGTVRLEGVTHPFELTRSGLERITEKYMLAVQDAGRIYRHVAAAKGEGNFIAEVSMDETDAPQTPPELLVILALLADEQIRVQTIAPKFTGRFNKGVDYVGDLVQFEREFNEDLAVLAHAVSRYGLPANLKLSVHSGSDKFSLYPIIRRALRRTGAGVHVKTAGTTWLEEIIGLSEAGGDGLELVREMYGYALAHVDELCAPYASVIDIDRTQLPGAEVVAGWSGTRLANAVRHIPGHPEFNANIRQLLHVSFKLAAQRGGVYLDLLRRNEAIVAKNVTENLFDRHLKPLFLARD